MIQETRRYSIHAVQDEVRALVTKGSVNKQQKIYALARYFGDREWIKIEKVLQDHEYLLRDYVCDLIGHESWASD